MLTNPSHPRLAPAATTLDVFERRLVEIWQRGDFQLADPVGTARLLRLLLEQEGFGPAGAVLADTGIRAQWNRVFAEQRSKFVAGWLAPHLSGNVLDVLGGDFTVLRALLQHGFGPAAVTGCERSTAYDTDWAALPFPVHDVPADPRLPDGPHHSALLCTVLHHEPDPERLLDAVARTSARRWVVVENCLDPANTEEFHLYVDEFFNRCLNSFNVPCVPQHRTAEQWRALLSAFGRVTFEETRDNVPGMPFSYTLLVVDR